MKKLLSIAFIGLFFVAVSTPGICDNPPKAKAKTETATTKKCDKEKCDKEKCDKEKCKGKEDGSAKCTGEKKSSCCKEKETPKTK